MLIGADDQHWLSNNWIPRAMEAGLRTVAMIMPMFYFNRVAIESVGQKLDPESLILQYSTTAKAPASARVR